MLKIYGTDSVHLTVFMKQGSFFLTPLNAGVTLNFVKEDIFKSDKGRYYFNKASSE